MLPNAGLRTGACPTLSLVRPSRHRSASGTYRAQAELPQHGTVDLVNRTIVIMYAELL